MGKQLDIYKRFKANNPDKYYLFKGGIFYYFLAEDAEYFNNKCGFKLTAFGDSVKCGKTFNWGLENLKSIWCKCQYEMS